MQEPEVTRETGNNTKRILKLGIVSKLSHQNILPERNTQALVYSVYFHCHLQKLNVTLKTQLLFGFTFKLFHCCSVYFGKIRKMPNNILLKDGKSIWYRAHNSWFSYHVDTFFIQVSMDWKQCFQKLHRNSNDVMRYHHFLLHILLLNILSS